MVTATEAIIDRRRLRKKITFWRVVTFIILAVLILSLAKIAGIGTLFGEKNRNHIASVKISGVITNDQPMLDLLKKLGKDDNVKAVILKISSPGGSTVGGEAIYEAVRDLTTKKPVATSVGTLAASAGYMIASASDYIVARRSSIVGSIGIIFQYADASQLLDKIGVAVKEIKSSPMKAEPSPFHTTSEEAKQMIDKVVRDSYDWFVDLVAERRNMTRTQTLSLADGSIYSGSQGVKNGLIDAVGDIETAKKWLVDKKDIGKSLKIVKWKPTRPEDGVFANPAGLVWIFKQFGINIGSNATDKLRNQLMRPLFLDGLLSMLLNSGNFLDQEAQTQ